MGCCAGECLGRSPPPPGEELQKLHPGDERRAAACEYMKKCCSTVPQQRAPRADGLPAVSAAPPRPATMSRTAARGRPRGSPRLRWRRQSLRRSSAGPIPGSTPSTSSHIHAWCRRIIAELLRRQAARPGPTADVIEAPRRRNACAPRAPWRSVSIPTARSRPTILLQVRGAPLRGRLQKKKHPPGARVRSAR